MELIEQFFSTVYDVPALIRWGGLIGLIAIVYAETGLLVGFFLPGDSLLVTAGLFAANGELDIVVLNAALMAAAIAGDATGYWIGWRAGSALYRRPDSLLFKKRHLLYTKDFYERHGGKTIVIARFVPILRTFAPVVAGVGQMGYRRFAAYNVVGGILWVASMTLAGYFLGRAIPDLEEHLHIVVAVVIGLSLMPIAITFLRSKLSGQRTA